MLMPSNAARISAEPAATAVTTPLAVTVAVDGFSDDQVTPSVTVLDSPVDKRTVRLKAAVSPSSSERSPLMVSPSARVTGVGGVVEFEHPATRAADSRHTAAETREPISLTSVINIVDGNRVDEPGPPGWGMTAPPPRTVSHTT